MDTASPLPHETQNPSRTEQKIEEKPLFKSYAPNYSTKSPKTSKPQLTALICNLKNILNQ